MNAWRVYEFGDFRLDDVPIPEIQPRHLLVEPLCVRPSVTETQFAFATSSVNCDISSLCIWKHLRHDKLFALALIKPILDVRFQVWS